MYKYQIQGGCGTTTISLQILDNNTFQIDSYSNWMGSEKSEYKLNGDYINKNNGNFSLLKIIEIRDHLQTYHLVTPIYLEFIKFNKEKINLDNTNDHIVEGIFMGGINFNNFGDNDINFDSVILFDIDGINSRLKENTWYPNPKIDVLFNCLANSKFINLETEKISNIIQR